MKQGKTLIELATALQVKANCKRDIVADTSEIRMLPTRAKIVLPGNADKALIVTPHCHSQLAAWTGIGSRYYNKMLEENPALLAGNVNHWLHNTKKPVRRMARTLTGAAPNGDDMLRAFMSDKYLRIDDELIFSAAMEVLHDIDDMEILSAELTDRKMYIKAVFPRTEIEIPKINDQIQSGITLSNCEIGGGSVALAPIAYTLWCANGCGNWVQGEGIKRAHLGSRLDSGIVEYAQDTITASTHATILQLRDGIKKFADPNYFKKTARPFIAATESAEILRPVHAVDVIGKLLSLTGEECGQVSQRLLTDSHRNGLNQYGMLNAITNLANDTADYDRATELENMGGRVLNLHSSQWRKIAESVPVAA